MKIAGIILILIGIIDVGGSWLGFDFWGGFVGIELPYLVWYLSGYAELGIGYFLYNLGEDNNELDEEDPDN